MPISIQGKRIIVTGGARGIGAAAVNHFVAEGAEVVSFDIKAEGKDVADTATAHGPGCARFRQLDLTRRSDAVAAIDWAAKELDGINVLFNIAAIERTMHAEEIGEAGWAEMLAGNLTSVAYMCEATFPHMKANGGGSIVNFASDTAFQPYPGGAHYSASKGAIVSYTRTLSAEWGRYGIRANCVMPIANTPMAQENRARMTEEQRVQFDAHMAAIIPLTGKFGDPLADIAPVLAFLASDASRYVSAQNIGVNGGAAWTR